MKKALLPLFAALAITPAFAATISLTSAADATIRFDGASTNYGTNNQLIVGSNFGWYNALVKFDLTPLISAAGAGQTIIINSVTLNLHTTTSGSGGSVALDLNSYGFDFSESTSTWSNPAGNGTDTTVGGTKGAVLSSIDTASAAASQNLTFATSSAFSSLIQARYNSSTSLVSFLLSEKSGGASGDATFVRIDSKDAVANSLAGAVAPTLVIDYTITAVPEPSTYGLMGAGALAAAALVRRRKRA